MAKVREKTKMTLSEVKDIINHIVTNNRFLQQNGKKPVAIEILGDSGLGKTSLVYQAAEELGLEVVKVNMAQMEEIGD